jgi:1-deoxy-D-xylulose-5-phosphate reductoisomerase
LGLFWCATLSKIIDVYAGNCIICVVKSVVVLGSTGTIGQYSLDVIKRLDSKFKIIGLVANKNYKSLLKQAKEFKPKTLALASNRAYGLLKKEARGRYKIFCGRDGINELINRYLPDIVICAIAGSEALFYNLRTLELGIRLANANKESIVMAGDIVVKTAKTHKAELIPIDSEHNAIFQLLQGQDRNSVSRIFLTASGGPFLYKKNLEGITPRQALKHPVWNMGKKITIDSATMMNKALEIIEAKWLFGLPPERICILIHPQSIVHSMVEFYDGVITSCLCFPDMRAPIQYALTYPQRSSYIFRRVDLAGLGNLEFIKPDFKKFPAISLGYAVARMGGTAGAVLNAADEECVKLFLQKKISFVKITEIVQKVVELHKKVAKPTLKQILDADRWAREKVFELV